MLENIEVLCHSSIRIVKDKIIYIDPYKVDKEYNDADYIFITHDHYDHFSKEDIYRVRKENSIIILPESMYQKAIDLEFKSENIITVLPGKQYNIGSIYFDTVFAYNINKVFHLKSNNWVGYILYINGISYYIAGDTDITEENMKVKCDVAFVPVGGTYTMTCKEAAELANNIKPKIAIPTHYGVEVGTKEDANKFMQLLDNGILGKILTK